MPGAGFLPINAFLILAREPVLVDTGIGVESEEFLRSLESIIDPKDIKWVWLTHDDSDHTGSLRAILELAPQARLATHAIAALRESLVGPLPLERVHALTLGESLDVGDRLLRVIRPPLFDNPMSLGFYDEKSGALLSVDSFGGLVPSPAEEAGEYEEKGLVSGMTAWATLDSPWAHLVEKGKFQDALNQVRRLDPKLILSAHLPPAKGMTEQLLKVLASVPDAEPFMPPNQEAFSFMLAEMAKAQG